MCLISKDFVGFLVGTRFDREKSSRKVTLSVTLCGKNSEILQTKLFVLHLIHATS